MAYIIRRTPQFIADMHLNVHVCAIAKSIWDRGSKPNANSRLG